MTVDQTAKDFMRRLDALKTPENASEVDSIKQDLHDKIFNAPNHDYTYIDKCCELKDVDTLREEIMFDDMFIDSACSLIQEVYDKAVHKGQISISDRIENVVETEPWGWPITKVKHLDWIKMSREEKTKIENERRAELEKK